MSDLDPINQKKPINIIQLENIIFSPRVNITVKWLTNTV